MRPERVQDGGRLPYGRLRPEGTGHDTKTQGRGTNMKLRTAITTAVATASLGIAVGASPAAADAGRYNHCGKSTQRHFQCVYLGDGRIATCPGGYSVLPIESLYVSDGNGDGFACANESDSLEFSEDAIVR